MQVACPVFRSGTGAWKELGTYSPRDTDGGCWLRLIARGCGVVFVRTVCTDLYASAIGLVAECHRSDGCEVMFWFQVK